MGRIVTQACTVAINSQAYSWSAELRSIAKAPFTHTRLWTRLNTTFQAYERRMKDVFTFVFSRVGAYEGRVAKIIVLDFWACSNNQHDFYRVLWPINGRMKGVFDRMKGVFGRVQPYEGRVQSCSNLAIRLNASFIQSNTPFIRLNTSFICPSNFVMWYTCARQFCHLHTTTWRGKWNAYQQHKENVTIYIFLKSNFISNSSYCQRESLITNGLVWYLWLGQVFRDIIVVIRYTLKALAFMLFNLRQKKKNQKYCTSKYPIVYTKSNITYAFILNYFFRSWKPGYFDIFNSTTRSPC